MIQIERRRDARMPLSLRLRLADGQRARVRNVSAQGIYIVLPPGARIDRWVAFEVSSPNGVLRYRATGQVLRIERAGWGTGVALRLHMPTLLPGHSSDEDQGA